MKIAVCFLAIISYVVGLPAEVPIETLEELDISKIRPKNIYLEPVNPVNDEGLPGGRIIGGSEVTPNSVPYQAAILINRSNFCGGSVISTTRILTAAHCTIDASFVEVRLGAHRFNSDEATQVRITSTSIINHNSYNIGGFAANDIAVILLPSAVSLNSNIQTIPLSSEGWIFDGSTAFLSGWGRTSDWSLSVSPVLRGVHLRIISNAECRQVFGNDILETTICTSGAGTVGACNGDSGGPLVVDGMQVGIVSFGSTRCQARNPTAYASVSAFRSWIRQNAGV